MGNLYLVSNSAIPSKLMIRIIHFIKRLPCIDREITFIVPIIICLNLAVFQDGAHTIP